MYMFTQQIFILTALDSNDKWRINKLEGKKATAARADEKPKTETQQEKVKEEKKDTKKATKTKTKKGDSEE